MPKLTLRDLFAVVTIVALSLGWWVDRSRLAVENGRLAQDNGIYRLLLSDGPPVIPGKLLTDLYGDQPSPSN